MDVPTQVSDILVLAVSFTFINFSFQIFLILFLKCPLASRLTVFKLSTLFYSSSHTHCILDCFLWSKSREYSSSNHGLCCFNSQKPRLSL